MGQQPPITSEFSTHLMVADVLDRWLRDGWVYTHIASGELRDKITAAKLKRMGLKPGWPDFILISAASGLHFLELKRKGKWLSGDQQIFAEWCAEARIPFEVCFTFDQALAALNSWGALKVKVGQFA